MTDNNDTLLREVEEELRREQWEKIWKTYGTYIFAVAALIVLVVGGKQFWDHRVRAEAEAAGAQFQEAMLLVQDGKAEEAQKALAEISETGPDGFAMLAKLNLAAQYVQDGKKAEALDAFEKLSKNSASPLIAGFARLQAAALKLGDADFTEMQNRLNDLAADTSPWRVAAKELLGTAAYKAGRLDEAKKIFTSLLGDPATSRDAVGRINVMMTAIAEGELGAAQSADPAKPAEAAPQDKPAAASDAPAASAPGAQEAPGQ